MSSLRKRIAESYRMEFETFMKRVDEYMKKNNISTNGTMSRKDMKQAYDEGKYPSQFVKEYVKDIDEKTRKGGYSYTWESEGE